MLAGSHENDQLLVARALARDPAALIALDARVRQAAAHAARRGRLDEADLHQSLHLALFERDAHLLQSYAGRAALTTWLTAIARRMAWRQSREQEHPQLPDSQEETESPERATLRADTITGVRGVLDALPEDERLLLKLLVENETPAHVVAAALGITPDGVRMRKMRLLRKLADKLKGWWP